MQSTSCEIAQAEIRIAGRNINNLRYVDDTNLMAEGEEELKCLFFFFLILFYFLTLHNCKMPLDESERGE